MAGTGLLAGSLAARLGRRGGAAGTAAPSPGTPGAPAASAPGGAPSAGASAAPPPPAGDGGGPTVAASAVAVGGAVKTADPATGDAVYVLQPEQGRFTALSAVCPHAQCVVNAPKDGKLVCPCHGSQFDAATGALLVGPATQGLARYGITRSGDRIRLGKRQA
ncbi:Rieske (2Fe-2S) protein [Streptacidiphilus sp. ASG 303]|uniref:Rieske (2Fe-2S) protein n=1 Tax=Streptacidiphilus sp. ASG 303 TaxID=2896847 RepID=UPI001E2E59E9|nr:Rieske (2Fe-2S) protein [Streptacidiphilus sp. ASG 303]MCD0481918.1 Rieske (2Fe-2S) protein [Streptacidiphilus sp. ASG 303]